MKKKIFIQNIIAPYRLVMFNALRETGFPFEVYFMGKTEPNRSWTVDLGKIKFPYWLGAGKLLKIGHRWFHLNPILVVKCLFARDAEIIMGSAWCDLNILCFVFLKRLGILRKRLHFWAEANYLTKGARNEKSRLKFFFRRFVFNTVDGYLLVPGKMSEITFEKWGINNRRFIRFPNTIIDVLTEKSTYSASSERRERPIFLIPARLNVKIKGQLNFFEAIGTENIRRAEFWLLGNGKDENLIRTYVRDRFLEENIRLLGFVEAERVADFYEKSDVFLLPSFSDPSPLTLVEAIAQSLPVLVSSHCGNHYESVRDGENGFLFSPLNPEEIKAAFEKMMDSRPSWNEMGKRSRELFENYFSTAPALARFKEKWEVLDSAVGTGGGYRK